MELKVGQTYVHKSGGPVLVYVNSENNIHWFRWWNDGCNCFENEIFEPDELKEVE